jgi:hypothetical protein
MKGYLNIHFHRHRLAIFCSGKEAPGFDRGLCGFVQPKTQWPHDPDMMNNAILPQEQV